MNERTHFFIKIYLSQFILERVDVGYVWETGTDCYTMTQVLLTIAALLSHLGWGCSTVSHSGPKVLCLPLALNSASCLQLTPTPTDSSRLCPGYIFVWRPPASAVLPLICTGASLDWRLSRGSICYIRTLITQLHSLSDKCFLKRYKFPYSSAMNYILPQLFFNRHLAPADWGYKINRLFLCRAVRSPLNECLGYNIKPSNDEIPALENWRIWNTPSLALLSGPLYPGVVASDWVTSMDQIEQTVCTNKWLMSICFCYLAILETI